MKELASLLMGFLLGAMITLIVLPSPKDIYQKGAIAALEERVKCQKVFDEWVCNKTYREDNEK